MVMIMSNRKDTLCGISVWPGVIVSVTSEGFFPSLIRLALGGAYRRLTGKPRRFCPSHTAMVVEYEYKLWIADTVHPVAKLTPLSEYESDIASGKRWNLQLFVPRDCGRTDQARAAAYWTANIRNRPYDWPAFGRLTLKAIFGDWFKCAAGLEWANWCSEGVGEAYRKGAKYDVFENNNPTPVTVIKRWTERKLTELTP